MAIRINKYLADHQYASRREADSLIASGKVFINGKKALLGERVTAGDTVEVRGRHAEQRAYFAYYKPEGVVTVNAQKGEQEILDTIRFPVTVYPLGRLDKDTSGLILFTNDGRVTDMLLNPKSEYEKEYAVSVHKPITHAFLTQMQSGVTIGTVGSIKNYTTKPAKVRRVSPKAFDIILTEGKNRQIRRMCGALGYKVTKLRRFRIATMQLGNLKRGAFREIKGRELTMLLKTLKLAQ